MSRILTAAAISVALGAPLADADPVMDRLDKIQHAYIDCAKRITAEFQRCETSTKNEDTRSLCLTVANQASSVCIAMVDMFSALAVK